MSRALDLLSGLVVDDEDTTWGERAADFQWADAEVILDPGDPLYSLLTRSRGGAKTGDLAGCALALLVTEAPVGSRSYALAADRDQGGLLVDHLAALVRRTPGLAGLVTVERWRVTVNETGASLEVLAADAASSWGLTPWLVVVDELAAWAETRGPRELWTSIVSAVPKVRGARLGVLTTAGDPSHWSAKVLDHARSSDRWHVSEVPGPLPWRSAEDLDEQRALLTESSFARLHLNRWTAPEDRLTTVDALRDAVTLDGERERVAGVRYVVSVDVGLKNDATACAVAHLDGERVVLDRMATWQGSRARPVSLDAVEAWLVEASERYNRAPVVADPYQAAQLLERLRRRGVRAREFVFSAQSVGRLAMGLYRRLRERTLALYDDEELLDELAHVRLRESSPGVYRLDHDADRHDDRAVALALVIEALGSPRRSPARADGTAQVVEARLPTVGHGSVGGDAPEVVFGDGSRMPATRHRWGRSVDRRRRSP